jgi:hypothetical protein
VQDHVDDRVIGKVAPRIDPLIGVCMLVVHGITVHVLLHHVPFPSLFVQVCTEFIHVCTNPVVIQVTVATSDHVDPASF